MPAGKSKYTYRRTTADSKPVFDGRKSDKKFNTWVRADVPGKQEGTAGRQFELIFLMLLIRGWKLCSLGAIILFLSKMHNCFRP